MWCKADFFAYLLVLPHDPSEIFLICWFGAKETFAIINKVENSYAALIVFSFIWNRNLCNCLYSPFITFLIKVLISSKNKIKINII